MTLSLSYANTVLWRSRCKIHRFLAAPCHPKQHSRHFKAPFNVIISVYIGFWWFFYNLNEAVFWHGRNILKQIISLRLFCCKKLTAAKICVCAICKHLTFSSVEIFAHLSSCKNGGKHLQKLYFCSQFRGPCRRRNPVPKSRIDIGLQFEGCVRWHEASLHCFENMIYVFPEMKLRGLNSQYFMYLWTINSQDRSANLAAAK